MAVKITRDEAVAVFEALGLASAAKWNAKRMTGKISKIDEMVDDDTNIEDEDVDDTLTKCLEAIENEEEIIVLSAAEAKAAPAAKPAAKKGGTKPAAKPAAKKGTKPASKKAKPEPEDDDEEVEETRVAKKPGRGAKPAAKGAKGAKGAKPAAKGAKAKAAPSTPGVRATRTRPFLAGVLIKKYGTEVGVTDAMIAELDEMYGKENPTESSYRLREAWHGIRGFLNGDDEGDDEGEGDDE